LICIFSVTRSHPFFKGPDDNPNILALMNILTTFALTHPQISYCQGRCIVLKKHKTNDTVLINENLLAFKC